VDFNCQSTLSACSISLNVFGEILDLVDGRELVLIVEELGFGTVSAHIGEPATGRDGLHMVGFPSLGWCIRAEQHVIRAVGIRP